MQDELDKNLSSLFQEKRDSLPEEPFLGNMLKLIERRRARRTIMHRAAFILGIVLCVLASPYLIRGSAIMSDGLAVLFQASAKFMSMPAGMATAAAAVLYLFLFKRRWISSLI